MLLVQPVGRLTPLTSSSGRPVVAKPTANRGQSNFARSRSSREANVVVCGSSGGGRHAHEHQSGPQTHQLLAPPPSVPPAYHTAYTAAVAAGLVGLGVLLSTWFRGKSQADDRAASPPSTPSPPASPARVPGMSNAAAWRQGNESYKRTFGGKGGLKGPPSKKVAIVGCMDARFHVEKALGLEEGDAHIIRNAGGRVSEDVIRSVSISQQLLGTEEVAVIHHTDCGMATFQDPVLHEKVGQTLGPQAVEAAKKIPSLNFYGIDLEESVRIDMKMLKDSPLLLPKSKEKISGYVYDVKSGDLLPVH